MTERRWFVALLVAAMAAVGAGLGPAAAAAGGYVEVVISAADHEVAADAVHAAGGRVTTDLPYLGAVAAQVSDAAVDTLRSRPDLDVALDHTVDLSAADVAPVDTASVDATDHLASLSLPEHWGPTSGDGVGVALLDTGVAEVPELEGRVVRGLDLSGDGDGIDRHGHGTFMAGLIAGDGGIRGGDDPRFGVAPGADIVSVKLAGADGRTTMSRVLEGIGWVIANQDEHDVRVLSLSLGVPTKHAPQADPLALAVDAAWASGLTVVTASGNEGNEQVTSPGRSHWALTVGATDTAGTATTGDDTAPDWSGAGKVTGQEKPEVLAPGTSVVSLRVPGSTIDEEHPEARIGAHHFRGSGTSMSTALVAGAAAVLAEQRPLATPDDLKGALASTTAPIAGSEAGAVDLAAADAADADTNWRQKHPVAGPAGEHGKAMPWAREGAPPSTVTWERVRWLDDQWQRVRWLDGRWQRVRWLEDDWERVRWLEDDWARVRWLDGAWQRVRWLDGSWQRVRWLDESFARVRWLDSHFARVRWLEDDWARVRWLGFGSGQDAAVAVPAAWPAEASAESDDASARSDEAPGRSGKAPGRSKRP